MLEVTLNPPQRKPASTTTLRRPQQMDIIKFSEVIEPEIDLNEFVATQDMLLRSAVAPSSTHPDHE